MGDWGADSPWWPSPWRLRAGGGVLCRFLKGRRGQRAGKTVATGDSVEATASSKRQRQSRVVQGEV